MAALRLIEKPTNGHRGPIVFYTITDYIISVGYSLGFQRRIGRFGRAAFDVREKPSRKTQ